MAGSAAGGGGPFRSEYRFDETLTGVITAVARPCLLVIRPQRPNGAGVLIAAGGGYLRIDIGNEGFRSGSGWRAPASRPSSWSTGFRARNGATAPTRPARMRSAPCA
ncbi:hypothetical protein GCM10025880_60650 [Methylorubrum aminovorans]|nr:hypothetical protein GCM10025880_60650 [Methylorubrum aminovorans]